MKKVFFPGSFNPFTKGHADIVERMLQLAETIVIGIGVNSVKSPASDDIALRVKAIQALYSGKEFAGRVEVTSYSGLTMEEAKSQGADCVVRGVRSAVDFDYEYNLAAANRKLFGIETLLLPADPALSCISSTLVRDIQKYGGKELSAKFLP